MSINGDGTLRIPRPEPVAYDDAMEDMAVCPHGLTFEDECRRPETSLRRRCR